MRDSPPQMVATDREFMERSVRGIVIRVLRDDITRIEADAVVNAANNHFWMGSGVAGAIKRAGGATIETDAIREGPVPVGESVVTDGGGLAARYVIHAAVMGQDLVTGFQAIQDATRTALERAEELRIRSIAFPAFGTGVGGFPPADSARAMIESALAFVRSRSRLSVREVIFVLFSDDLRSAFDERLAIAMADV